MTESSICHHRRLPVSCFFDIKLKKNRYYSAAMCVNSLGLYKYKHISKRLQTSNKPLGSVASLLMAVCVRSWSRNWPHCMTISVWMWCSTSRSSCSVKLTFRAPGRSLPVIDFLIPICPVNELKSQIKLDYGRNIHVFIFKCML